MSCVELWDAWRCEIKVRKEKKTDDTHLEGRRKRPETRSSSPCHWAPPSLLWTEGVPRPTRSRCRVRENGDFCSASCPTWVTPRWRAGPHFCFDICCPVTGRAGPVYWLRRCAPLVRSPQNLPGVLIPAQDSLRTTEVPYNPFSRFPLRRRVFFLCSHDETPMFSTQTRFTHRPVSLSSLPVSLEPCVSLSYGSGW